MLVYDVSHEEVMRSVWFAINVVTPQKEFDI